MQKREYYKVMNTVFSYYSVLFFLSSVLSFVLIKNFHNSWMSIVMFASTATLITIAKPKNINDSILSSSLLIASFAWLMTYLFTFETIRYTLCMAYLFSSCIMCVVSVSASHFKLRFSCAGSYLVIGIYSLFSFPPLLMITEHTLTQSIVTIAITFYETAMLIAYSNFLILYKSVEDPYEVFLKVNGR